MNVIEFKEESGWVGAFTRNEARGAYPNGTKVMKVHCEDEDMNTAGAMGTVIGSMPGIRELGCDFFYFVEWDKAPRVAVGIINQKISRIDLN